MGGGPREMAEHFTDLHSSRLVSEDSGRGRHQGSSPPRNLGPQVEEIAAHLARFRERAERLAPPSRRTQMTQTIPATLMPVVTSSFLQLQDLPAALAPTAHLIQVSCLQIFTHLRIREFAVASLKFQGCVTSSYVSSKTVDPVFIEYIILLTRFVLMQPLGL